MKSERIIHWAKGAAIFCLALFSLNFPNASWAHPLSALGALADKFQNQVLPNPSEEIQVHIQEGTLCQALLEIEKKAEGFFKCPKALDQIKVFSRTIQGATWASIVTQLLSDYNTILIWKNDKELESIFLLGLNSGSGVETHAAQVPQRAGGFLAAISKLRTQWANAPLSEEFFNHPGFQKIFKTVQINSPEDWQDPKKRLRMQRELRKLYKVTQQKMKASEK